MYLAESDVFMSLLDFGSREPPKIIVVFCPLKNPPWSCRFFNFFNHLFPFFFLLRFQSVVTKLNSPHSHTMIKTIRVRVQESK
jgi:hypothetical protein